MRWRWWRTADEMADDFSAAREPESDESFIASCELPDDPLAGAAGEGADGTTPGGSLWRH